MQPEILRTALRAYPFLAFRLKMADRSEYRVGKREWAAISADGRQAAVFANGAELHVLDVSLVTSLELDQRYAGALTRLAAQARKRRMWKNSTTFVAHSPRP
jgi:hypothetical protein